MEAGFSLEQAVQISTLNRARYLGWQKELGSLDVGKRADIIVVDGNPLKNIGTIHNVEWVFKDGVGYDSKALLASVKGLVGVR